LVCLLACAPLFRWINELSRITRTVIKTKRHRLIIKPLKAFGLALKPWPSRKSGGRPINLRLSSTSKLAPNQARVCLLKRFFI
jgi:hypothetical protein